jgi:hypothetical protein
VLVADAKSSHTKPIRKRLLYAVLAVVEDVKDRPELYATPRPLGRAFATVPNMPQGYDLGALLDELCRLKLFAIEHHDSGVMLVAAESATAKVEPAKDKPVTLGAKVSADLAARFRDAAVRSGTNVSALIASLITEYLQTV